MSNNLDYRNFVRVDGKLVYDYDGKLKKEAAELAEEEAKEAALADIEADLMDEDVRWEMGTDEEALLDMEDF
jgi:hypothetical protein